MHILLTGSREWTDMNLIDTGLRALLRLVRADEPSFDQRVITIIHGGARGADLLCAQWAERHHLMTGEYKADWKPHGRGAGPIRNQRMLDEEQPIVCAAFLIPELPCRGTRDMIERCLRAGVPVLVTPGARHR